MDTFDRPILKATLLHLLLVGAGLSLIISIPTPLEIPFDLLEAPPTSLNNTSKNLIQKPIQKVVKVTAKSNTTESSPTESTSSKTQTTQSVLDGDGPIQEEYDVTDMPILLNEIKIAYPAEARSKNIQGTVIFDLVITSFGLVQSATLISSPDPSLSEAASQAIRGFKFRPAKIKDKPVAIRIRYSYRFVLQ